MPQNEDNLLDDFLQKLEDDESIEDLSKYILETVFNKLLEREMDKHLQAEKYERSEERSGHRNGYRERKLYTRVGTLNLRVPETGRVTSPPRSSTSSSAPKKPWC